MHVCSRTYICIPCRWNQDFKVGAPVLVKFTGETKKPTWPAQLVAVRDGGFEVKWTQPNKLPDGQKLGGTYFVSSHRAPANAYRQASAYTHITAHTYTYINTHIHCLSHRYTWIRSSVPPSRKKTNIKKRTELAREVTGLLSGKLPIGMITADTQLKAKVTLRKQQAETLSKTLKDVVKTGGSPFGRAPSGRPVIHADTDNPTTDNPTTPNSSRIAPPSVNRAYVRLRKTFTKGEPIGRITFVVPIKLGNREAPTCTIHIVDPGAVYGISTPCPTCGFGVRTKPQGWTKSPR